MQPKLPRGGSSSIRMVGWKKQREREKSQKESES